MWKEFRPAITFIIALTLITGVAYPLRHDRDRQGHLPELRPQGSLIERDGKVIGSALIGQVFSRRQVFPWPAFRHLGARSQGSDQDRRCTI